MRRTSFQGNVHIINFPAWTAAADLAELFDEFGLVLGAEIKEIPSDGGELRLGIVAVAPDAAADKAIEALQGYALGGQKLKLKRAKPQPVRDPTKPRAPRAPRPERPVIDRPAAEHLPSSPERYSMESADYFPVRPQAAARPVIVEYRGRRAKRVV